jgi:hypothetical protein
MSKGQKWAGAWGVDNPNVNTNLSPNVPALKRVGIKVHGILGTADVLAPDALAFKDLCEEHGVQGQWLVWKGTAAYAEDGHTNIGDRD